MYWHTLGFPFLYGLLPPIASGFAGQWGWWAVFLLMTYYWWFGKGARAFRTNIESSEVIRAWIWIAGAMFLGIVVGTSIEVNLISGMFQGEIVNAR